MVFWLFKKREKRNLILDELNAIKEKVTQNENDLKSLENAVSEEMRRVYNYISEIHNDIDALGEVVQEIKSNMRDVKSEKLEFLERKIKDLESNAGYIRIIGKVALSNHERLNRLEAKVDDALKAIDSIVNELRGDKKLARKAVVAETLGGKSTPALVSVNLKNEADAAVNERERKEVKKDVRTGSTDYLAELRRLRKELLELKSTNRRRV